MTWPPRCALVTDRGRWGSEWRRAIPALAGRAAEAGVDLFQVREHGLETRALASLVAACRAAMAGSRMRLLVNDRLDVALAEGADGVHLPGHGLGVAEVRLQVPEGFLIGRSVRGPEAAAGEAGMADVLVFGTVFQTVSKPGVVPAGLTGLARVTALSRVPVLAIGGVNEAVLGDLALAGAAGIAAIGWLQVENTAEMRRRVLAVRSAFDTLGRQLP